MAAKMKPTREDLDAAMHEAMRRYGHRGNVTGFDVGYRWDGGKPTGELCVRIHVERKIPKTELESAELFPKEINGVQLDVIQGNYKVNRDTRPSEHRARTAVLMGGFSCGRPGDGTGTIGSLVIDNESGRPAILSNWHVLAGPMARNGDPIVQPGDVDGGTLPADEVASLRRWMLDADGDAAVALLNGRRAWLPLQFGFTTLLSGVRTSVLGEVLHKSGRTTGRTTGRVDGEGVYRISYEVRPGVRERRDIRGFKLVPERDGNPDNLEISEGGDSGSFWVNPVTNEAVGLHFAGERSILPSDEHAIACQLPRVMERLNVRLATVDDVASIEDDSDMPVRPPRDVGWNDLTLPRRWPDEPLPFPWPWPPRGWPWPLPPRRLPPFPPYCPVCGSDGPVTDHPPFDPRLTLGDFPGFDRGDRGIGFERTVTRFGIVEAIWPRLYRALVERSRSFRNATLRSPVRSYFWPADAGAEIAATVNGSDAFDDLDLPHVIGRDINGAATFFEACVAIDDVLRRRRADLRSDRRARHPVPGSETINAESNMLSRQQVTADVAKAIREVVIANTPFTDEDPDVSERGYRRSLRPGSPRWNGWGAEARAWGVVVMKIVARLAEMSADYAGLEVTVTEIDETLTQRLADTQELLTDKIMERDVGNA